MKSTWNFCQRQLKWRRRSEMLFNIWWRKIFSAIKMVYVSCTESSQALKARDNQTKRKKNEHAKHTEIERGRSQRFPKPYNAFGRTYELASLIGASFLRQNCCCILMFVFRGLCQCSKFLSMVLRPETFTWFSCAANRCHQMSKTEKNTPKKNPSTETEQQPTKSIKNRFVPKIH